MFEFLSATYPDLQIPAREWACISYMFPLIFKESCF
jgi:hypothetical protein